MFCSWLAVGLLLFGASCRLASAASEQGAVEGTLYAYENAWSHHDARAGRELPFSRPPPSGGAWWWSSSP